MKAEKKYKKVMVKAVMKHAGLSQFDREGVENEIEAIVKALHRKGFTIKEVFE